MEGGVKVFGMSNTVFEGVPERFDFIEVRGVRRQRQKGAADLLQEGSQNGVAMEGGIVENDHLAFAQEGTEVLSKPGFHPLAVAVAGKGQWSQNLSRAPGSHQANALSAVAQAFSWAAFSFFAPAIGIAEGVFHSGFIHVDSVFRCYLT